MIELSKSARAATDGMPPATKEFDVITNGVRLHTIEAGEGTPVVLLHGFPDFSFTWRHQIPELAQGGFRTISPDLRGYNLSEKPPGVESYGIDDLVADVAGLIEQRAGGRAHLVGHDWGGIIAQFVAMHRPEVVDRLVIMNAPHPAAYSRDLTQTAQWRRSLYVPFFQIPWLPEKLMAASDYRAIERTYAMYVNHPDAQDRQILHRYRLAASRPGALRSAINYYRALLRPRFRAAGLDWRPIANPSLILWGVDDPFLEASLVEGLDPWFDELTVELQLGCGHWVHLDAAERVTARLIDFLS